MQTHVHRFRTPQSVCSAASIFTTCSKEFGALGAAVVRCPGCALQVGEVREKTQTRLNGS